MTTKEQTQTPMMFMIVPVFLTVAFISLLALGISIDNKLTSLNLTYTDMAAKIILPENEIPAERIVQDTIACLGGNQKMDQVNIIYKTTDSDFNLSKIVVHCSIENIPVSK